MIMEEDKKKLLLEQASKIADVINVLRTQFDDEYEDEINFLEIVKGNLASSL